MECGLPAPLAPDPRRRPDTHPQQRPPPGALARDGWARVQGGEVVSRGPELLAFLVQTFVDTIPAGHTTSQFGLSLSAHLDSAGNIQASSASGSFYGSLVGLNLAAELQQALAGALGYPCTVRAAVRGLAVMDAAILLGTSVGGALLEISAGGRGRRGRRCSRPGRFVCSR